MKHRRSTHSGVVQSRAPAVRCGRALRFVMILLCVSVLFGAPGRARAGIADTPLPQFSDGKPSVQVMAIPGVVKRVRLQTEFLCSSVGSTAVDIGVEIFDADGLLLNSIGSGVGAVLNVAPGQTVTIATKATAAYLESAVIPLPTKTQGSARIVASAASVRCNVVVVDDAVTPPVSLATLSAGVAPTSGPKPSTFPLPRFSDGKQAGYAAVIPGAVKRRRVETDVFCTSLASQNVDLGVEVFGSDGVVANSVAADNGAVLDVAPGSTVTIGTTGTVAFLETTVILMAGVAQGMARVVSTSPQVICTAFVLDSDVTPPTSMSGLAGVSN